MKIVNIVLCGKFSTEINVESLPGCIYKPEKFSGGRYKHHNCTFLLFPNGSFVCLGAKSKAAAKESIKSLAFALKSKVLKCSAKNIVMSHDVGFKIDLNTLYDHIRTFCKTVIYENELFNGITWRELKATVRLFHNGKFFVTGLRNIRRIRSVCVRVKNLCALHKINKRSLNK